MVTMKFKSSNTLDWMLMRLQRRRERNGTLCRGTSGVFDKQIEDAV
jgi:hypothetical protein